MPPQFQLRPSLNFAGKSQLSLMAQQKNAFGLGRRTSDSM